MSNLQPLQVRSDNKAPFVQDGRLVPPVAVQTAAWLVPFDAALYLWINGPDGGETTQLRISPKRQIDELPMLDIVTGGVVYCQREFILTGTDLSGQPVVLGVTHEGKEVWRTVIDGTLPTMWPSPYCIGQPIIVWQTAPDKLRLAQVQANGLLPLPAVDVGISPKQVTCDSQAIYAIWADSDGIRGHKISSRTTTPIQIDMPYPDNLAIGTTGGAVYVAWEQGKSVFLAELAADAKSLKTPIDFVLGDLADGKISIVAGRNPVLWVQRSTYDTHEAMQWQSALVLPNREPMLIDGLIHRVAWWGDTLVVVGSVEILFFKST